MIDTGVGIKYEDQDKLFKLFGFVKDTKSMNTNGIGLGLVLCESLVKVFDGTIDFKSEPGEGSTFKFTFQLENPDMVENRQVEH